MRHLFIILSLCLTAGFCFAGSAVYVDDNAPGDPGAGDPLISDPAEDGSTAHPYDSIQQAIDSSDPNFVSEVIILPGTYTGNGNRDLDFKGKPITVRSTNPDDPNTVAATIIDCQGTQAEPHRGFHFHSGETQSSVLKGVSITNGYGAKYKLYAEYTQLYSVGGGVLLVGSSATLEQLTFRQCRADLGGAICTSESDSLIGQCEIDHCTALMNGGGVFLLRGNVCLNRCTVAQNSSNYNAGGVSTDKDGSILTNCTIVANQAPRGGAFHCHESSLRLQDCDVLHNAATGSGGFRDGGALYLHNCTSNMEFRNSLFSGNYSKSNGGAIYVEASMASLSNCTIAGNRAGADGGGIYGEVGYLFGASVQLKDCIVWGNEAARGDQIAFGSSDEPATGGLAAWYSDIEGGLAAVFKGDGRFGFYEGTLDVDPLFADQGRWDDNGTPADMSDNTWIAGDYHLKSYAGRWNPLQKQWVMDDVHSPCIDAGGPASDFSAEPAYNGGRINMGVYGNTQYASKTPSCLQPPVGDLNNDCKVTFADLALFAATWLDCNLDPPVACE